MFQSCYDPLTPADIRPGCNIVGAAHEGGFWHLTCSYADMTASGATSGGVGSSPQSLGSDVSIRPVGTRIAPLLWGGGAFAFDTVRDCALRSAPAVCRCALPARRNKYRKRQESGVSGGYRQPLFAPRTVRTRGSGIGCFTAMRQSADAGAARAAAPANRALAWGRASEPWDDHERCVAETRVDGCDRDPEDYRHGPGAHARPGMSVTSTGVCARAGATGAPVREAGTARRRVMTGLDVEGSPEQRGLEYRRGRCS